MNIEAVTVCVGYADFLSVAIESNAGLFDRWIIVTAEDDHETRNLCRRHSLQTILSADHKRDANDFAKGRMIERGLQHLSALGWRVHIDADTLLPPRFRHLIAASHLDERNIYGCDRVMVRSYQDWQKLKTSGWIAHDWHCRIDPPTGFKIGSRWAHHGEGYVPIGFFQMWHSDQDQYQGARIRPYPANHNDACRTDVQFALQWDRRRRELIPELLAVHLESEACHLGKNWRGRKTKRFGPPPAGHCHRHSYGI